MFLKVGCSGYESYIDPTSRYCSQHPGRGDLPLLLPAKVVTDCADLVLHDEWSRAASPDPTEIRVNYALSS